MAPAVTTWRSAEPITRRSTECQPWRSRSRSVASRTGSIARSFGRASARLENINVLGDYRRALEGRSHPTDDDEFDALLAEDEQQSS